MITSGLGAAWTEELSSASGNEPRDERKRGTWLPIKVVKTHRCKAIFNQVVVGECSTPKVVFSLG